MTYSARWSGTAAPTGDVFPDHGLRPPRPHNGRNRLGRPAPCRLIGWTYATSRCKMIIIRMGVKMYDPPQFFIGPIILIALAAGFWFWMWWPRHRVPKAVSPSELKRIEAEEKFRQTIGQFFAAAALLVTFGLTIFQTFEAARQWTEDHRLRAEQERLGQFTEGLKALSGTGETAHVAALYSLAAIADKDPAGYRRQITDILVVHVRRLAAKDIIGEAGLAAECGLPGQQTYRGVREEANPEVQAAMNLLGMRKEDSGKKLTNENDNPHFGILRLEHLFLDDLDLADSSFVGAMMSNSYFRRTNFARATLRGTDFRGAHLNDWDIPGFPKLGTVPYDWLYKGEHNGGAPDWQKYRCWVTDFREAKLQGANFEGAMLAGADFERAEFDKNTNFTRTDLSRANLRKSNITAEQIGQACGSDQPVIDDEMSRNGVRMRAC
jgi:uncharacterized protein YjbI with pentapeptide repeats